MDRIFALAGLTAFAMLIVYIVRKVDDYHFDKNIGTDLSVKVYRAARAFAQGENTDRIRNILINSIDFDEDDIEEILSITGPHRNDDDRGYQAFLDAAEKVSANY